MASSDLQRHAVELLAEQFASRMRKGEEPSIDHYVGQHPQYAQAIRELFPTVAALERMRRKLERRASGRASLGPTQLKRLGDFRIIREIGRGGMGIVYEAQQESLDRRVAVKVLPKTALLQQKSLQRFAREAKTAARLHHTNIVPVLGVGQDDGFHYYVMQYIDGVGLDTVIARLRGAARRPEAITFGALIDEVRAAAGTKPTSSTAALCETRDFNADDPGAATPHDARHDELLPTGPSAPAPSSPSHGSGAGPILLPRGSYWRAAAELARQAAAALAFAHEHNTLHRDIKPANLLLDRDGTLWVADFGVAKALEQEEVTRTGDIVGTLRYMAPEQARGEADARSDIYALGLTLYELLAWEPAFDEAAQQRRFLGGGSAVDPPPPRKKNPAIPRDLETIVLKAAAYEPARRYPTAAALAADLQRYLEDRPIEARRSGPVEHLWRWAKRKPAVAGLSALAVVLLLVTAATSSLAYVRTKAALISESDQRQRAEKVLGLSLEALDRIYQQFASDRMLTPSASTGTTDGIALPSQPALSKETAALLQNLLTFYDRFAELDTSDLRLSTEAAKANRRMGDIYQRLGQYPQADSAYHEAITRYQRLIDSGNEPQQNAAEIARIRNELASVLRQQGREDEAKQANQAALETLRQFDDSATPAAWRFELARTYYDLGRRPGVPQVPEDRAPGGAENGPPPGDRRGEPDERGEPPLGEPPPAGQAAPAGSEGRPAPPPGSPTPFQPPPGPGRRPGRPAPPLGPRGGSPELPFGDDPAAAPPDLRHEGVDRGPNRGAPNDGGPAGGPPRDVTRGARGPNDSERRGAGAPPPENPQAREYLGKAIAILTVLRQQEPGVPDYTRLLALCYREQARGFTSPDFDRAAALLEGLVREHPKVNDYRSDLCETYSDFDVIHLPPEFYAVAEQRLRLARQNAEQLDSGVAAYLAARIHINHKLSTILRFTPGTGAAAETRFAESVKYNQEAVDLQSRLVELFPETESYRAWRARIELSLAMLWSQHGRPNDLTQAAETLRAAAADLQKVLQTAASKKPIHRMLFETDQELGHVLSRRGDYLGAKQAQDQADEHRRAAEQP